MTRRYYTARNRGRNLGIDDLYSMMRTVFLLFRKKDYFKGKAGITTTDLPEEIQHEAILALSFQPFPISEWPLDQVSEENVFDVIEFLHDHVSKPCDYGSMTDDSGWNYYDYARYDEDAGRAEFREKVNSFLVDCKTGYELTFNGTILALGTDGLQHIVNAEIPSYDEQNVDSKVRHAIAKWRNRQLSIREKKEAIRELADVFEWLKKTKQLSNVLDQKDESALFDLANNFAIRHHDPKQKANYDPTIWYSWIFHFYLATYHASIRLLIKNEHKKKK